MNRAENLQPLRCQRRGDTGVTWIIVSLLVIVLVGIVFFYLSSIENSQLKRETDKRLNTVKETLQEEKEAFRRELSVQRGATASVQAEIDRKYQELTDELLAERENLRQHRNSANRAEYEIAALESEIAGLESMIDEMKRQVTRLRELSPPVQAQQPPPLQQPDTQVDLSVKEQRPPTQAIIEDVLLKIGKTLEARGLRAAADAKGPVVGADGFKIRNLVAEMQGASSDERKFAAENLRLARQELQQPVVMAGLDLKKRKLPPFNFEILEVLETMRAELEGEK